MVTQWYDLFLLLYFCFCVNFSKGINIITRGHPIKDHEVINSTSNTYELGFFSPINTTNRYVGIWFAGIPVKTVVWVANRDRPLNDSSGMLAISENGNLVLVNGENETIWSTNLLNGSSGSTAQLLDSGNLILFDNSSSNSLWESFQFPTDSFLKNMRLYSDANTNEKTPIRSWKSSSDPSVGRFSAGINPLTVPDLYLWNGDRPFWRSGPWNGQRFIGITSINAGYLDGFNGFNLVENRKGQFYLTFAYARETTLAYYTLSHNGSLLEIFWNEETGDWETTSTFPENECDVFGTCGPFGSCSSNDSPICSCLRGYAPKDVKEWDSGNFTNGCVRSVPLQCSNEGFFKMASMKVPESPELLGLGLQEDVCRNECLKKCSCLAYSHYEGIGCMSWSNSLVDIKKMSAAGADLYIRVLSSELDDDKKNQSVVIAISVVIGSIIITLCAYLYWRLIVKQRGRKKRKELQLLKSYPQSPKNFAEIKLDIKLEELPLFKLKTLSTATDNFPLYNKLGQGGFGTVYKGKLVDGKEIAVKRLASSSNQGLEEFMNEVVVISKLQHRNLVRLLGCCIEGEEKMLVYEYMPNKSLDAFLFDPQIKELLDWRKRWSIIEGIGRGLLYLHRDSRLKIIHRDLKASNILLDEELNPKISDFGMARIFGGTQNQAKTQRVVGTYGYMAPEYAMDGQFSEKSDVFSFGVVLLEIVSGRRNTSFNDDDKYLSLLQYVWKMWNDDNAVAIIDSRISCEEFEIEILRCIHIGLLCVHEFAVDRPNISSVLSMLSNEVSSLATPTQPAFTQRQHTRTIQYSQTGCSVNGCTITSIVGR